MMFSPAQEDKPVIEDDCPLVEVHDHSWRGNEHTTHHLEGHHQWRLELQSDQNQQIEGMIRVHLTWQQLHRDHHQYQ
jgi:hypothetical protein